MISPHVMRGVLFVFLLSVTIQTVTSWSHSQFSLNDTITPNKVSLSQSIGTEITVDKLKYRAGEKVTITGSGWLAYEKITVTIREVPNPAVEAKLTLTATAEGKISDSTYTAKSVTDDKGFLIQAIGQTSGASAQARFTTSSAQKSLAEAAPMTRPQQMGVPAVNGLDQGNLLVSDLTTQTPEDLLSVILGPQVKVSNVVFKGTKESAGSFSGGANILGFENGILLSSGRVKDVVGPNKSDLTSTVLGTPGDADLNSLIPGFFVFDATVLEFDFIPANSFLQFDYVFSSEEYNEWVYSSFNDVFGFFVNGKNAALIPGTNTAVSINNVNGGRPFGTNPSHAIYYRNNDPNDPGPATINTEMDGLTVILTVSVPVQAGQVNHIKMTIGDAGDRILDSNVFIRACSFTTANLNAQSGSGLGSVLVYNYYSSELTNPKLTNARLNLTNTNPSLSVTAHLFFIDGGRCEAADMYVCLTPNQTFTMLASDFDPGVTGYVIAVAVDSKGCPLSFNHLTGNIFVKTSEGYAGDLEAVALQSAICESCGAAPTTATIDFDGMAYSPLPRELAIAAFPSPNDGNQTMVILNRIGGNLLEQTESLDVISGLLVNDLEKAYSFTMLQPSCQFKKVLSNTTPRTAPPLSSVILPGHFGWMRLWTNQEAGILGAVLFTQTSQNRFGVQQGRNLHHLSYTQKARLIIPVYPPNC